MFCFIGDMESVNSVSNMSKVSTVDTPKSDVNAHMKNSPLNVGVIVPPDAHYKPVLYSHQKATAEFNQLNRDIYEGVKRSKNINEKKTPLSIKIIAGIGAVIASIYALNKFLRR